MISSGTSESIDAESSVSVLEPESEPVSESESEEEPVSDDVVSSAGSGSVLELEHAASKPRIKISKSKYLFI